MPSTPGSNATDFTVSELSQALKRTVEDMYGYVRVRGELGRVSRPGSGHVYLDLKDDRAVLAGVIWKGVAGRLAVQPEQGLEVIATGKLTTFPGQSKYQMVIDHLEPAGVGALMALLEERRKALAAEGLFDESQKQVLPFLPRHIGVITSPTGAVIRDILHRLADRFPVDVTVWPVRVQGDTSGAEVANGIRGFNALPNDGPLRKPDLLIVARGGGSLEDLWGFNDEAVVRAAADSAIPLISAVGHETDWTLIDHVADRRAPTPTGAAEIAVPVRSDLLAQIDDLDRRRHQALLRSFDRKRQDLRGLARALPRPADLLAIPRQRLDTASTRLGLVLSTGTDRARARLNQATTRLIAHHPARHLTLTRDRLEVLSDRSDRAIQLILDRKTSGLNALKPRLRPDSLAQRLQHQHDQLQRIGIRLDQAFCNRIDRQRSSLTQFGKLLATLSYQSVLSRGFALVRDEADRPVRSAKGQPSGTILSVEFADGHLPVQVSPDKGAGTPTPKAEKTPHPKRLKENKSNQGSLF